MKGEGFREIRDRLKLSQAETAEMLNSALGKKYRASQVSAWETDARIVPAAVAAFMEATVMETALGGLSGIVGDPDTPLTDDTIPDGDTFVPQAPLSSSGVYARACTDMWGMVAMLVSTTGALSRSDRLVKDGLIIDGDKEALGRAWGKLAETNETFRKMLLSATTGGAWLEVALVTSTTAGKLMQNHARAKETRVATHHDILAEPNAA